MLRRLFVFAATLVLPAVLVAQARPAVSPTKAGALHPSATQRLGDVVRPTAAARPAGEVVPSQTSADKDEQEGPEAKETPEATEGPDADEGPEATEGPEVKEGPDVDDDPKVERSEKADKGDDKSGENETAKPVAPAAAGHSSRIGSHRP